MTPDRCLEYPCTEAAGAAAVLCAIFFVAWIWWDDYRERWELMRLIFEFKRDNHDIRP